MPKDAAADGSLKRQRLAQRRKALGLTQEALACLLDVERSTVIRWEHGETAPLPYIRPKLAETLRVTPDGLQDLLAGSGPASPAPARVPHQLPASVADFAGRAPELAALTRTWENTSAGGPGTVVISAIGGTAGVGKTALALHWAHQVAGRFGDGQLYVNLRGFDPSGVPATPAEAIRGFLHILGVAPERIPPLPDAQASLYRSLLADKRVLIVLDNARDEQQVRPLLPASPGSLVIITSRSQMSGLAATDGARLLTLDVLTRDEARQLLTARLGGRAAAEPAAIEEIAGLCAHLPLALTVTAARAATRPGFPLAALAAELRDTVGCFDALDSGDPAASVRAVFSWSYRGLSSEAARMFRLLGLHAGPDITGPAAASLAGRAEHEARRMLWELTRAHLVVEHVPGRYAFHDLLRAYAAHQASAHDSEPERIVASGRVLDHYLHTAHSAAMLLSSSAEPIVPAPPRSGVTPELIADRRHALAWFEAEQHVLLAAATVAAGSGFESHAWQIPWAMTAFLTIRGPHQEWAATQRTTFAAAARLGDAAGQAMCVRILADALSTFGDYDQVAGWYADSLRLYRRLGDRLGEARDYQGLGYVAERQGRYSDALSHVQRAARLYHGLGQRAAEADMLNTAGWYHALLGDCRQARAVCRRSLALCAELGDRHVEGKVWGNLGCIEKRLGNIGEAAACYQRALSLFREFGDRLYEADSLTQLGNARYDVGEPRQAREAWLQAVAILDELGHPDAGQARAKLADTEDTEDQASAMSPASQHGLRP